MIFNLGTESSLDVIPLNVLLTDMLFSEMFFDIDTETTV